MSSLRYNQSGLFTWNQCTVLRAFSRHLAKPSPIEFLQRRKLKSLKEILQRDPGTSTEACSLEATIMHHSPPLKTEAGGLNKVYCYKGHRKDHRQRLREEEDEDEQERYTVLCVWQVAEARLSKTISKCTK